MITSKSLAMARFCFKPKNDEVLNHWIAFAEQLTYAPLEFYELVEKELATRKVPGLEVSRVEYSEGGLLSDQRVYLRMIRERLAFDTCAAPFGTGFFFSCRTVYSPPVLRLWHVLAILVFLGGIPALLIKPLGLTYACIAQVGLIMAVVQVFRNAATAQLPDLDTLLLKIPVVGLVYERFFREDTYYRQDTRLVYLEAVPRLVKDLAEDVTAAKGIKLVRQYQSAPVLGELYKPTRLPAEPESREP